MFLQKDLKECLKCLSVMICPKTIIGWKMVSGKKKISDGSMKDYSYVMLRWISVHDALIVFAGLK